MDKIIVTGGNGFIGRHLIKKLIESKPCIVIISNSPSTGRYSADQKSQDIPLTFYTADIRDKKALLEIFQHEKADTCIHLAAKTSVNDSIKNPKETMEINIDGTLNVLQACYKSKIKNFLFASSAAVYGDVMELPIKEDVALGPLSPYGSSKMLAERHVLSYEKSGKIQNVIMLRIFNVYGPGQTSQTDVISKFAARISKGLPPIIYGDGTQTRDFISVDDVVNAMMISTRTMEDGFNSKKSTVSPIFNMGTGKPTSIKKIAEKMIGISGLQFEPMYAEEIEHDKGILHSYADMTKTREFLNFIPKKGIDIGLSEIIGPRLLEK